MKYHVLLVDDHPAVTAGTKLMLEQEGDFEVKVCGPQDDIVNIAVNGQFDVMLFDLRMPGLSGIELSKQVLARRSDAKILIYTGFDILPHFTQLIRLGVIGFIPKTSTQERLIQSVRLALNKETVIPHSLLRMLCDDGTSFRRKDAVAAPIHLTNREIDILKEVAQGKSNKLISENMHMSQRSLEYALTQLFQKLSVQSRVEAVNRARALGIIFDET
jgi:two-component system competent response regulator ComA